VTNETPGQQCVAEVEAAIAAVLSDARRLAEDRESIAGDVAKVMGDFRRAFEGVKPPAILWLPPTAGTAPRRPRWRRLLWWRRT
jgi:hypothetical protein